MYVDIDIVKTQLNVDHDFYEDDAYIQGLIDAAELTVANYLDMPIEMIVEEDGDFPAPLKQAVNMLVTQWYDVRQPAGFGVMSKIPFGVEYLIQPYRSYKFIDTSKRKRG